MPGALRLPGLQAHTRRPDKALVPPSGTDRRGRCACPAYKTHARRPDKALVPPSGTDRRGRCACPAYKHVPVGRIRRLRRQPARNAGGAALARPKKHARRPPDKALVPPSGTDRRGRCACPAYKARTRRPDKALAPPSGTDRRGRFACPAYKHTPVGRIRRLRRQPAYRLKERKFSCRFTACQGRFFLWRNTKGGN